ncbi:MAG: helix-turn-helix domain-containing protein [Clostridia bacterium]|nr:helix-turn-helix domain-containing protein [Clostridia bacterium]
MSKIQSQSIDTLLKTISLMDDVEDLRLFFEDVCTIHELHDMAQRFEVAVLLDEGLNYQQIAAKTNVSTATISRVSRCLNYGDGGYQCAIEKLKENNKKV